MANGTPRRRTALVLTLVVGILIGIAGIAATNAMVHWSSSNDFCSNACHSMQWVAEAYRRSSHFSTPSGVTAGCADCHIPYHSGDANAAQYVVMLAYKAKAGLRDAIAQARGVIDTKEKWEKARDRYSEEVTAWMAGNGSLTCRGCHDMSRMGGETAQQRVVARHAKFANDETVNCVDCHDTVGHVYEAAQAGGEPAKAQ
jgi:nitrate/TMAO reductase-like tetraheme cytochrome c subunit